MREYLPTTNSIFWIGARMDPMPKDAIMPHGLTRSGGETLTTLGNFKAMDAGNFIPEDDDCEDVNFIPVDYTTKIIGTFSSNKYTNFSQVIYGETSETPLRMSDIISPSHRSFKLHWVENTSVCRIKAGDFIVAMGGACNNGYLDKANVRTATIMLFLPSGFSAKNIRDMSDPTTLLAIRERIEDFCCTFKLAKRGNHELSVCSTVKRDYESEPLDAMGEVRFATRTTTCKKMLQVSRDFFSLMPPLDLSDPQPEKMSASEFAADQVRNRTRLCSGDVVVDMTMEDPSAEEPSGKRAGRARNSDAVRPGGSSETAPKRTRTEKKRYSPTP